MFSNKFLISITTMGFAILTNFLPAYEFRVSDHAFGFPIKQISLVGSFNSWSGEANKMVHEGSEFVSDIFLKDGQYEYKLFIIGEDGKDHWLLDPNCNNYTQDGNGGFNNALWIEDNQSVKPEGFEVFEWTASNAKTVFITGTFNDWNLEYMPLLKEDDGVFRCRINLPRPITYKYFVDDEWQAEQAGEGITFDEEFNNLRPTWEAIKSTNNPRANTIKDETKNSSPKKPDWAAYSLIGVEKEVEKSGSVMVYARSQNYPGCKIFEKEVLLHPDTQDLLEGRTIFFLNVKKDETTYLPTDLTIYRVPTLAYRKGKGPWEYLVITDKVRPDEIYEFLKKK